MNNSFILLIDIGGTFFKYCIYNKENKQIVDINKFPSDKENIHKQLINFLNHYTDFYKSFQNILISIACITIYDKKVNKYNLYPTPDPTSNLNITKILNIPKIYKKIPIKMINDADAYILGQKYKYKDINFKTKNCLGIIFGTGVGSGISIQNNIIYNSHINQILEDYMKKNYLTNENLEECCIFIAKELSKIIELLNIDVIFISGYVLQFENFKQKIMNNLTLQSYFKDKLEIYLCDHEKNNSIFYGLLQLIK